MRKTLERIAELSSRRGTVGLTGLGTALRWRDSRHTPRSTMPISIPPATFLPTSSRPARPSGPTAVLGLRGADVVVVRGLGVRPSRSRSARADGVRRGDRVAILDKNNPAVLQVLLGGCQVGAATTVVNWRLAGDELDYVINDCGAEVLFVGHQLLDQLALVRDKLEHVRRSWSSVASPTSRGVARGR